MLAIALSLAGALAGMFTQGVSPIDTTGTEPGMLRADACGQCHEAEYAEWRGSRHAAAWTNGLFQRDYQRTPRQWCRNCHIPLDAQQREVARGDEPTLAAEGVSCAVCHVRGGRIVARRRDALSPHDTIVDDAFGSPAMCEGCHQFNFPRFDGTALASYTDEPMQNTVGQFRRNRRAPATCLACHGGGAGHAFPGSHSPAMLDRALGFELCRDGDMIVTALTNRGAAHNVPTGDVHRHVLVQAWLSTVPDGLRQAYYGRRYALDDDGARTTVWDSTLAPGATKHWRIYAASLGEPAGGDEPINIEVRYVYTETEYPRERVGEPTYRTVYRTRARFEDMPACER